MENFEMKKKFGQNFLRDKNLLSAIVKDANITENDTVVEIGPGAGALTEQIAKVAKRVIAFEIDTELEPILKENLKEYSNIEIRFSDILKVDLNQLEDEIGEFKVVANLPYYITTPIIFALLENCKKLKSLTIMVQKEVAEKIVASPKDKNYGVLSVMSSFYAKTQIMRIVGRQMFHPVPKVDSAIVRYEIKQFDQEFAKNVKKIVFSSFNMRRKTLANNLSSSFSLSREEVNQKIENAGLNPLSRAETLGVEDFVKLTKQFY